MPVLRGAMNVASCNWRECPRLRRRWRTLPTNHTAIVSCAGPPLYGCGRHERCGSAIVWFCRRTRRDWRGLVQLASRRRWTALGFSFAPWPEPDFFDVGPVYARVWTWLLVVTHARFGSESLTRTNQTKSLGFAHRGHREHPHSPQQRAIDRSDNIVGRIGLNNAPPIQTSGYHFDSCQHYGAFFFSSLAELRRGRLEPGRRISGQLMLLQGSAPRHWGEPVVAHDHRLGWRRFVAIVSNGVATARALVYPTHRRN